MTELRKMMLDELQRRNYSEKTATSYLRTVREFCRYFNKSPDKLGPAQIREYQAYLLREKKHAPSTVVQEVCALRFLFVKTMRRHYLLDHLPFSTAPSKLPTVLSPEEVSRLIEAATNAYHRILLVTLYATGVRVSELCHLRVPDIDSKRMMVRVERGKGGRDRLLPLSPTLLEELRDYWRWMKPKTYLFPGMVRGLRADVPLTTKIPWMACQQAAERAGLSKHVSPHTMRHSYVTALYDSGTDLRVIQVLLGHSSLEHTMVYVHLSQRHLESVANPLDGLMLSSSKQLPRPRSRPQR